MTSTASRFTSIFTAVALASATVLAGCDDPKPKKDTTTTTEQTVAPGPSFTEEALEAVEEVKPYASVQECVDGGVYPAEECQKAFDEAMAAHAQAAPEFDTLAACEEQFGEGKCQAAPTQAPTGGTTVVHEQGSSFAPFFWGFMIGHMMSGNRYYSTPVYPTRSGSYVNSRGTTMSGGRLSSDTFARSTSPTRVKPGSAFVQPASPAPAARPAPVVTPRPSTTVRTTPNTSRPSPSVRPSSPSRSGGFGGGGRSMGGGRF